MSAPSPARESLVRVWLADALHAARSLLATPRYSLPAFVSLVLGIGASTAVFAIFSAVVLRPLPFPHEEELVRLHVVYSAADTPDGSSLSFPYYDEIKQLDSIFSSVSVWLESSVTVTGLGEARHAVGASVSPDFFDTLQTPAVAGRTFTSAGPAPDTKDVVVLSRVYARTLYGEENVVGRTIVINGGPKTIVGVVDDTRALPAGRDLWLPMHVPESYRTARGLGLLRAVGRLKHGVSFEVGRERLQATTRAQNIHGDDGTLMYATYKSLRESLLGDKKTSALLMVTAVAAFLLLACANVAALLVTRASVRARELAVRAAVGAGSSELARHAGLEALALTAASSVVGLAMAAVLVRAANRLYATELEYAPAQLDARVLGGLVAVALVSTLAIGLAPTLYALRIRPMDSLRADGRSSSSLGARKVREALVAAQVAITLALVVSASVLVRSVAQLHAVAPGMDASVVTGHVAFPPSSRSDLAQQITFARTLLDRLEHAPGVTAGAIATDVPFDADALSLTTENGPGAARDNVDSLIHYVSPGYFGVMGIPLLAGRAFTRADEIDEPRVAGTPVPGGRPAAHADGTPEPRVVAVSRAFAVEYLGTEKAVGRRISFGDREGDKPEGAKIWLEIVAVVGDVLDNVVTDPPRPTIYLPYTPSNPFGGISLVVRGPLDASGLMETLARVTREASPEATLFNVDVIGAMVERSYRGRTALEQLLGLFALASLVLAAIGLFGVTSYAVAERSAEIGIRRALGASRGDIIGMVLGETSVVVGLGIAGGVACALGTRQLLASFLYGVVGGDVATYVSVAIGVVAMSMLAALAPAYAAANVTPSRALEVR